MKLNVLIISIFPTKLHSPYVSESVHHYLFFWYKRESKTEECSSSL